MIDPYEKIDFMDHDGDDEDLIKRGDAATVFSYHEGYTPEELYRIRAVIEWFRCDECLPEKGVIVITVTYGSDLLIPEDGETVQACINRNRRECRNVGLGFLDDDSCWVDCSYGFPMNPHPLYWMPLPAVPDLPDYNAVDEEENIVDFKDLFEKIWEDDTE